MEKFLEKESLPYLKTLSHILGKPLVFVDLEATGLVHENHFSIIEIGMVIISPHSVVEQSSLVDPQMPIPAYITNLTGIDDSMVQGKKTFFHFNQYFHNLSQTHIFCGYNSKSFDATGIIKMSRKYKTYYSFSNQIDVRYLFLRNRNNLLGGKSQKGSLTEAAAFYNVKILGGTAHRAAYDIALTVLLAEKILATHGLSALEQDIDKLGCVISRNKFKQYLKLLHQSQSSHQP